MKFYADLHIHSKFSRATSQDLNLENLNVWGQLKGLKVISTGDCIHPQWLKEIQEKLEPAEDGLFKLKKQFDVLAPQHVPSACQSQVRFILTAEISNIYKKMDKVRKIHNVIFMPSFEAAEKVQKRLDAIGNIRSDGRPILGLDSRDLLEIVLESDPLSFLVPAHIWTPWFSALGSKGGFDVLTDCYGDLSRHIFAVETGLSSDPAMNWRLSQLDAYALISNSDAHSAQKLAREANIFNTILSYPAMVDCLKKADKGLVGTVEFFPQEGKYHYDGHRNCQMRMHPRETIDNKGLCPKCGKPVTVGVMARVEELADHPEGRKAPKAKPFLSLIPLAEIIAEAKGCGANTKSVREIFFKMLARLGNELFILNDAPIDMIRKIAGDLVAEGIDRVRRGQVRIDAGYDGEYGHIKIFSDNERQANKDQMMLFS